MRRIVSVTDMGPLVFPAGLSQLSPSPDSDLLEAMSQGVQRVGSLEEIVFSDTSPEGSPLPR